MKLVYFRIIPPVQGGKWECAAFFVLLYHSLMEHLRIFIHRYVDVGELCYKALIIHELQTGASDLSRLWNAPTEDPRSNAGVDRAVWASVRFCDNSTVNICGTS